jgi:hypothetical protein
MQCRSPSRTDALDEDRRNATLKTVSTRSIRSILNRRTRAENARSGLNAKDRGVPVGKRTISAAARIEGDFLESRLPVRAFATLTTVMQASQGKLDDSFRRWVLGLQAHNRLTIGWIKTQEHDPQRHAHVALVAGAPLDCFHAESLWRTIAAPHYRQAGEVKPYRSGLCGLGYILKQFDSPAEDVQFSDNLTAFAHTIGKSQFRSTSAQRRQHRRIGGQLRQK